MPKLLNRPPSYRLHKASGQAVVTLDGRDHYLGPHGSKSSQRKYQQVLAEFLSRGCIVTEATSKQSITVVQLLAVYRRWCRTYYRDSRENKEIGYVIKLVRQAYGRSLASEFGPLKLKALRQQMIELDLCRNEINKRIGRIKRIFKWGVENELVEPSVYHGLQAVAGLVRGRSQARETDPVKPVPEAFVDAIKPHVTPQIWAMIELQRLTGMRPGEVTQMRSIDVDTTGAIWTYTPVSHKTAHHGHRRQIFLGPKSQDVLRPWLRIDLESFLFQPSEAMAWFRMQRSQKRKTPSSCGNRPGSKRTRRPQRQPSTNYRVSAYGRAIRRACETAKVPHWHPHQLRHNAATRLRKEFGLDIARVVLGHRSQQVTEVYAELDFDRAKSIMGQVG